MAQRRKKFKGFKVVEVAYYSFDDESDVKTIRQICQCKESVEKCAKTTQVTPQKCVKSPKSPLEKCGNSPKTPSEKCDTTQIAKFKVNKNTEIAKFKVDKIAKNAKSSTIKGEYCPKITGCCWDYTQKKKTQKQEEEETKNAA